jgi:membrane protease YdiL (CAAX protease family)
MTKNRFDEIIRRMQNLSQSYYVCIFIAIRILIGMVFMPLLSGLDKPISNPVNENSDVVFDALLIIVISPLCETFFVQHLPFVFLFDKVRSGYIITFSALMFSMLHIYSAVYMISAFFAGLVYAFAYWIKKDFRPFVNVCLIHAGYNGFSFFWNNI